MYAFINSSEWKSHVMSSAVEKIHTTKNKITYRSVKYIFSPHDLKNYVFPIG